MTTALVLAGGGLTGIARESGVLLGLRENGVDVPRDADLIIGTSAGSVVGLGLRRRSLNIPRYSEKFATMSLETTYFVSREI